MLPTAVWQLVSSKPLETILNIEFSLVFKITLEVTKKNVERLGSKGQSQF